MVAKPGPEEEEEAAAVAVEVVLRPVPAATITTFGSIRLNRIELPSRMIQASVFRSRVGAAGRGFNFRTASSITRRPTIRFLITFTAIVRMAPLIAAQAAPALAAAVVADSAVAFRAA